MRRSMSACVGLLIITAASYLLFSFEEPTEESQVKGNSSFAIELYGKLKERKGNLFFSPYSISSALAMTSLGAAGSTKEEMDAVFHFNKDNSALASAFSNLNQQLITSARTPDQLPALHLANAIWLQTDFPILPTFTELLVKYFNSGVQPVDFANDPNKAREEINQWVEKQTQDKIKNLFMPDAIDSRTRLVLVSAIYMQAKWRFVFEKSSTKKKPFYLTGNDNVDVDMMTHQESYPLLVMKDVAVVEIPYASESNNGPDLAMIVMLPKDHEGLAALENTLSFDQVKSWMDDMELKQVQISLPKFKIEDDLSLNETLEAMGIKEAFSPKADFSNLSTVENLAITKIVHKSYIAVDEKGTEAAAATGVAIGLRSLRRTSEPYPFVADHPFLFMIVEKQTGTILFMGRLTNP